MPPTSTTQESEAAGVGVNPQLPWASIPKFTPGTTNVQEYTQKLNLGITVGSASKGGFFNLTEPLYHIQLFLDWCSCMFGRESVQWGGLVSSSCSLLAPHMVLLNQSNLFILSHYQKLD